jgi:hypothetical protein
MRKLTILLTILLYASCSTTTETIIPVVVEIVPRNVEIVLTTNAPSFDEIWVTYKDFDLNTPEQNIFGARQFDYDNSGNPEPIIISLPFKVIFFVLVDGWFLIVGSLVRSFGA